MSRLPYRAPVLAFKGGLEFVLEFFAGLGNLAEKLLVFCEQFGGVPMGVGGFVRVFAIEVVAVGFDLLDGYTPRLRELLPLLPPFLFGVEFADVDWLGLVVGLYAGRVRVFVVPDFFGRFTLGEK